jgi:hypothetical protein
MEANRIKAYSAAIDFVLLVLAFFTIYRMQINRKEKAATAIAVSIGAL